MFPLIFCRNSNRLRPGLSTPSLQPKGKHSFQTVAFDMVASGKKRQGRSILLERAMNHEHAWKNFLQANCNSMFQTALLLSANAHAAEAALADSIDDLDLSSPPENHSLAIWERAVIKRSIGARESASPAGASITRSMLQPGLRTVIGIERCPRICLVLHLLLGYDAVFCAQMLGTAEERNSNPHAEGSHPALRHHDARTKKSTVLHLPVSSSDEVGKRATW